MSGPVEDMFFNWLCAKVVRNQYPTSSSTYEILLKTLHSLEFVWFLPGDDTRAEDGKLLRREFIITANIPDDPEWREMVPCSIFELLVAFSRRASKQTEESYFQWFWEMLSNLNLDKADDASGIEPGEIEDVIEIFNLRQYTPSGDGGLFPLNNPTRDQTELELWDQFCDYLVDQDRLP